ncbi:uncharacterized protein LOC141594771 [Silene latifolia]|uniref:uncharacterized protein LOC141594771 n=1 Tax=Silene latifolia TaxID=37657 RepID=UPI003D771182
MVELKVDQEFSELVKFKDELGQLIKGEKKKVAKMVRREWRPVAKKAEGGAPVQSTTISGDQAPVKRLVRMNMQDVREEGYSESNFGAHSYKEVVTKTGSVLKQQGESGSAETKIKPSNFNKVVNNFNSGWSIFTNTRYHKGGRIWVLWQRAKFKIQFIEYAAQFIHMKVDSLLSRESFYLTYIYAFNGLHERLPLRNKLRSFANHIRGPWVMGVDFNCVLARSERCGGNTSQTGIGDFKSCVNDCGMIDIQAVGSLYTWNNKQSPEDRTYISLDRFMINKEWVDLYPDFYAHFMPEGHFDHTPCIVGSSKHIKSPRSFKYFNMWGQEELRVNSTDLSKVAEEFQGAQKLREMVAARDSFLSQKAKCIWINEGDANTAFFHGSIKSKRLRNRVVMIEDKQGKTCKAHSLSLLLPVTADEVKKAIFIIHDIKAPGPDGYTSKFYKDAWNVVGNDVTRAVQDFFNYRRILKQINSTNMTLIRKCERPQNVTQLRPVACFNVIYKAISKILCSRLGSILPDIVDQNQGAFIKGRSILENILICQDLIRLYNRPTISPRCMFKIDLQKAYDTFEWKFINQLLDALNFPLQFKELVMQCVSTASFSLSLNGENFGFFQGKRGLRQGDPLYPLLFTLCMDYLTRIINYVARKRGFKFHPLFKELKLTNLMFADDVLMFCKGDASSMLLILKAFNTFSKTSGLKVSPSKSNAYFNGVYDTLKNDILSVSGFKERSIPFKYLGMPIQTTRHRRKDCDVLIEMICKRIHGMGANKMSYAGRLVLIKAVLTTFHSYWTSIFIIPKGVIKKIEAICRNFLWDGSVEYKRVPLVAWTTICRPKEEGGLDIQDQVLWNKAMVGKLVNWVAKKKDSLWVKWVHQVYIMDKTWLDYSTTNESKLDMAEDMQNKRGYG